MPADPTAALFDAVSFAARAHRHQVRKDGVTPYAAHPFRVCLVVRQVFGIADPKVLAAAVLHDVIEDTPADYDDLAGRFGADVAGWAAALTKDMRRPEEDREAEYLRVLAAAPWPVVVCKLADVYDNLADSRHLSAAARAKAVARSGAYLAALGPSLPAEAAAPFAAVAAKLEAVRAGVY